MNTALLNIDMKSTETYNLASPMVTFRQTSNLWLQGYNRAREGTKNEDHEGAISINSP